MKSTCYQIGGHNTKPVVRDHCFFKINESKCSTVGLDINDYAVGTSLDTLVQGMITAYANLNQASRKFETKFSIDWPAYSAIYDVNNSVPGTVNGEWPTMISETNTLTIIKMTGSGAHIYGSSTGYPATIVTMDYTFSLSQLNIEFDKFIEYDKLTRTILSISGIKPTTDNGVLRVVGKVKTSKGLTVTCTDGYQGSTPHYYDVDLSDGSITSSFRVWYEALTGSLKYGTASEPWLGPAGFLSESIGIDLNALPDFFIDADLDFYDVSPYAEPEVYSRI